MDQNPKQTQPSSPSLSSQYDSIDYQVIINDLPKLTSDLDAYIADIGHKVKDTECRWASNVRTTDCTMINFEETKRDQLWKMKTKSEFIDSVLVAADGYRETVHIDIMYGLEKNMIPFFDAVDVSNDPGTPREYQVDAFISSALLHELVFFAYHGRCNLTEANSMQLATIGAQYRINSLVQYWFTYLLEHCSPVTALKAFQLATEEMYENKPAAEHFQKYIEDNFDVISQNPTELKALPYAIINTILKWDKLNLNCETVVWNIIADWTETDRATRLQHLPQLIKECLRFGRLPESFIRESILNSQLFLALPSNSQQDVSAFINSVLHGQVRSQAITDGRELLYAKSIVYFRPRETKQLLIAAGGWIEGRTTYTLELYDYQLNLWLATAYKLPYPISYFGFETIDTTLYVFGGSNGRTIYNAMSYLDLSQPEPQWIGGCSMIERRCYLTSVVLDGQLYALGGFNQQRRIRKCERYNKLMDCWFEIAELNYARSDASAAAFNGKIYIAGGINDVNIEQSVEVYHPETNHWQVVKQMSSPRTSFALTCFGSRIWAIGGNDGVRRLNTVESYNPEENEWREERPLINGRSTFQAINFNGELYVVGGFNGENPIRSVEKYVPAEGNWVKSRSLLHQRSGLSLVSVPNTYTFLK